MDSPESNTPSAASTATLMSGTVPKMAYPQSAGAGPPIYRRLAVITPETGGTPMSVRYGILATLEAKPGRGDDLAAFLTKGRELAVAEAGTVTWYAFKLSDTTYGSSTRSTTRRAGRPTSTARSRPRSARSPTTCSPPRRTSGPSTSSP
jgi:hypothetical protein